MRGSMSTAECNGPADCEGAKFAGAFVSVTWRNVGGGRVKTLVWNGRILPLLQNWRAQHDEKGTHIIGKFLSSSLADV